MAENTPIQSMAIGDHVRLKSRDVNQHKSFEVTNAEMASFREPVDGMVLSIRDVKTGQLVPRTTDETDQYIIELVTENTFNSRYASLRNAPRGSDNPFQTATWKRMQAALRGETEKGHFYSTNMPNLLTDSPMAKLLDGWKIIKIWSRELTNLEKPAVPAEQPAE